MVYCKLIVSAGYCSDIELSNSLCSQVCGFSPWFLFLNDLDVREKVESKRSWLIQLELSGMFYHHFPCFGHAIDVEERNFFSDISWVEDCSDWSSLLYDDQVLPPHASLGVLDSILQEPFIKGSKVGTGTLINFSFPTAR